MGLPVPPRPIKPNLLLSRIVKEGKLGDCPICHSSQVRKYFTDSIFEFGPKLGCIQPECKNYFNTIQYKRDKLLKKLLNG